MFLKTTFFILFLVLVLVLIKLSYRLEHEDFDAPSASAGTGLGADPSGGGQSQLSPIIMTVNSMVDFFNLLPNQLYTSTINMSKSISSKIKEYAETMKTYNRTPDPGDPDIDPANDDVDLKSVMVNDRHGAYLDNLYTSNNPFFNLLASAAADFYKVPFDQQDDAIIATLTKISQSNGSITQPLAVKVQQLQLEN